MQVTSDDGDARRDAVQQHQVGAVLLMLGFFGSAAYASDEEQHPGTTSDQSNVMKFLKTTLLGGLFVLLPLLLLWVGLKEIGGLLEAMAAPIADLIADLLPPGMFDDLTAPGVVATALIIGASLILGLAARSAWLSSIGRKIENSVLNRVPMYRMLKVISSSLIGADSGSVRPALIMDGSGGGDPCYVVERHKDGRATVLLPWSPASFAGSIKIVQQSDLEYLSCSLDKFSRSLSQIGVGVEKCLNQEHSEKNKLPEMDIGQVK